MIVDISHVSADCMRHALRITQAPVIYSHSSARAVADHPRNVPDDVLEMTRDNGGVVMINFFNDFVHPIDAQRSRERSALRAELKTRYADDAERAKSELRRWEVSHPRSSLCTVHDVLDHIDHVVRVAGIDHVGLGSDFDGVPALPRQLDDVSTYPVITQGLIDRGYDESEIRRVLGGNVIRVLERVEQTASRLGDR
jgi:membrane dipeptidase